MLGAPGSVDDPRSPAYFSVTIGDRVLFAVDQATLTSTARATLDGQAEWLTANAEYTALIEGHADEQGTQAYNLALGAPTGINGAELPDLAGHRPNALADHQLRQGAPDRDLLGGSLLHAEPPCRDRPERRRRPLKEIA